MRYLLEESSSRRVTAQERVRREIAEHLHGPVQGRLLALRARLDELVRGNGVSPEVSQSLKIVADELGQVIQRDIAALSRRLYPAIVRRGLVAGLKSLVDRFEAILCIELRIDEGLAGLERADIHLLAENTRLTAYRIVEEALTNVVKHAKASQVVLNAALESDDWLTCEVRDTGLGFELHQLQKGMGFAAMHDYAVAAGGSCVIDSCPGAGTTVLVRLPIGP